MKYQIYESETILNAIGVDDDGKAWLAPDDWPGIYEIPEELVNEYLETLKALKDISKKLEKIKNG